MSLASKISKAVSKKGPKKSSSKSDKVAKKAASVPISPEEYGPKTVLPKEESSKNFEKKFRGTKVVDENNKPKLLYHGRTKDYEAFDTSGGSSSVQEVGTHLGTQAQANDFATYYGGNVVPAYVDIKNPLRLEDYGGFGPSEILEQLRGRGVSDEIANQIEDLPIPEQLKAVSDLIKGMGHDGIVYLNKREGLNIKGTPKQVVDKLDEIQDYDDEILRKEYGAQDSYIILDPTQAKSPFNKGAYSETDDRFNYNKGGSVKTEMKRLLAKGGLKQEGNTKDPVSGNNVPVGAMQEEVRDDIPAQLSEGEFVFPADVVRFIGLERLMVMRQMAKKGLMQMEDMGQMSNGDEADEEDDIAEFESEIDDIMEGMESKDKPREMAVGGMVSPMMGAPAAAEQPAKTMAVPFAGEYVTVPTMQNGVAYEPSEIDTLLATGKLQPTGTYKTMEEATAATASSPNVRMMAVGGMAMPPAAAPQQAMAPAPAAPMQSPASAQTPAALGQAPQASSGQPSTRDIISESMNTDSFTPQEKTAVSSFLMSDVAKDMVTLRNNNTLFMVMGAEPGVVTAQTFSIDPPDVLQDSVSKFIASLKEANIKELRGETKNPMLLQSYEESGLVPESTEENGIISYRLSIPQGESSAATPEAPPVPPEMSPAPSPTPMV